MSIAENTILRLEIAKSGLRYKVIAARIGVTPEYLSRCMRFPLKPEMEKRIQRAIDDLKEFDVSSWDA